MYASLDIYVTVATSCVMLQTGTYACIHWELFHYISLFWTITSTQL